MSSQTWRCTHVISKPGKLSEKDLEFRARLGHIRRFCFKTKQTQLTPHQSCSTQLHSQENQFHLWLGLVTHTFNPSAQEADHPRLHSETLSQKEKKNNQAVVMHAFNPSTWEAEAHGSL